MVSHFDTRQALFWFTLIMFLQFYKRSNGSVQIGSMCTLLVKHFTSEKSAFLMHLYADKSFHYLKKKK